MLLLVWRAFGDAIDSGHPADVIASLCAAVGLVWFAVCAVPLWVSDVREHRLPNRWTLLLVVGGVVTLGTATLLATDGSELAGRALRMVLAGLVYAAVLFVLHLATRGGMGMGDVKLAAGLGVYTGWLSWDGLLAAVVFGFLIGGLVALMLVAVRRATRSTQIAFGPSMMVGALVPLMLMDAG
ncbi:prepilin peptidase [Citricoccus muralis]|uniref:A24 family peptidase n=1 Tax=Citricoccus muralis TaxID=169134 RepID=A0ABY8H894_9MICC|nr:A24 family peptidase [Citricoccus muralis]WFP17378.1 A24 family peptidase [Citricoccus muralis]